MTGRIGSWVTLVVAMVATAVPAPAAAPEAYAATGPQRVDLRPPLEGRVIVLDPGHQLGNRHFPARIGRSVPAGGFRKPCNTTGTATNRGYPEASFTWDVALRLRARLKALGATVVMTRHSNRQDRWGPCVDERGRAGNAINADLKISVHGDGSYARGAHGFHVIAPVDRAPWTHDIYRASRRLALATRAALLHLGLARATYVAGGDGLDFRRRPGHAEPLGRADRDGRARQHAQPRRRRADDPAEGPRALRTRPGRRGPALPGALTGPRGKRVDLTVKACRNGYGSREHPRAARLSN